MKKINKVAVLALALAMVVGVAPKAFAASASAASNISIVIPSQLSFTADLSAITLTFADYISGSETDTKNIVYTVKANSLTKNVGAVSGKLDALFAGADLKALAGSYTKTSGNGSFTPTNGGYVTINTTGVDLMDHVVDSTNGKTSRGSFPITYKAVATRDLSPDDNKTQQMTVTLVDA